MGQLQATRRRRLPEAWSIAEEADYEKRYQKIRTGALAHEEVAKSLAFRPFGGWNYGYGELYQNLSSWTIWAFVTSGSFAVDWREAAIVLGASMWAQETIKNRSWGSGASWVHNIQAGYCFYHYWFRKNKRWPVFLGVLAEAAGDFGAVIEEVARGKELGTQYSHKAHIEGFLEGMVAGFILDKIFTKKHALI